MIRAGAAIWLGLRLGHLALECLDRGDGRPVAVIDQHRIHVADHPALEPGMAVATAQALVADLKAVSRDSESEVLALEALALWAYQVTPAVTVAADNTLLLEIGSCQRLHGDLMGLIVRLRADLEQRGHRVAVGLAHTPKAAWLLAQDYCPPPALRRDGLDVGLLQQQLAAVPIDGLPVEERIILRLQHMGIETLGRVLGFEPALIGKRFGADFIRYLQQLTGHLPDPQPLLELPPVFDQHQAFLDGVANRQTLLFPMKRLLQTFSDYLVAQQLYCRAFEWRFSDAHRVCGTMLVELSRPHHRWKSMLDVSALKLDQVELPELVFSVTLYADQFVPAGAASFQLFAEDQADDEGHALLDKLASRLGVHVLQRVSTEESLWPEVASQSIALSEAPRQVTAPAGERPTWLLPMPERLSVRGDQLCWHEPLEILRGPERLDSPPDRGAVRHRDYFIARETSGRICWIFRELDSQQWFVHGLFA